MLKVLVQNWILLVVIFLLTFFVWILLPNTQVLYIFWAFFIIGFLFIWICIYFLRNWVKFWCIFLLPSIYYVFKIILLLLWFEVRYYAASLHNPTLAYFGYFMESSIALVVLYFFCNLISKNKVFIEIYNRIFKKLTTFFMKWVLYILGILVIMYACFLIYANIYLVIDVNTAWESAHNIINEKYEHMCQWWFHENLTLNMNGHESLYEFSANSKNNNCSIVIFMWKYGEYDSWIWIN